MKVTITAQADDFDAQVSPIFKQTEFFLMVDLDDKQHYQAIANPHKNACNGSDVFCALLVIGYGAQAVITGYCNPDAIRIFKEANIKIFEGVKGSVRNVIQYFEKKELSPRTEDDNSTP